MTDLVLSTGNASPLRILAPTERLGRLSAALVTVGVLALMPVSRSAVRDV